ncbi:DUF2752 domain-containing protein [Phycisphaeraceae bacterium D3-23]
MTDPATPRILTWLRYPVLATLLKTRRASVVISIILVLQLISAALGVAVYQCPILSLTGVPCPGCGLSRGAVATLLLDPAGVWWWNAFGPAALAVVVLVLVSGALPARPRTRLVALLTAIEQKTGVTNIALSLLWVYWIYRLIVLGGDLGLRLSAHA